MVAEAVIEARETPKLVEALTLIDEGLSRLQSRELISANEVADLLLDVRTLLTATDALTTDSPLTDEAVGAAAN
jgi:hypothetical protein